MFVDMAGPVHNHHGYCPVCSEVKINKLLILAGTDSSDLFWLLLSESGIVRENVVFYRHAANRALPGQPDRNQQCYLG